MKPLASAMVQSQHTEKVSPAGALPANETQSASQTASEMARRLEQSRGMLTAIRSLWTTLHQLSAPVRSKSTGRLLQRYEPTLRSVFNAVSEPAYRPLFTAVKVRDESGSVVSFDVQTSIDHMERARAVRSAADALRALADQMDDDALYHGSLAVDAGLAVLKVARPLAESNEDFAGLLGHALDDFASMTSAARRALSDAADSSANDPQPDAPKPVAPVTG